jgi:uncharacterized protein with beta-barrel porin domain
MPSRHGTLNTLNYSLCQFIIRRNATIESKRHVLIGARNQKLETRYTGKTLSASFETAYRVSRVFKIGLQQVDQALIPRVF